MASSATAIPPDVALREILLCLPPQPSCLLRASLVCKRWRAVVTEPHFLRQYRARHRRGAPILGVFHNSPAADCGFIPTGDPPDRVPASRFPLSGWIVLSCRRGSSVVLHDGTSRLLIWDPVSGDKQFVPIPLTYNCYSDFTAVLVDDGEDNVERRGGRSFRVAVAFVREGDAFGVVYSSDSGAWANHVTKHVQAWRSIWTNSDPAPVHDWEKPAAVMGDAVHWLLKDDRILSLELGAHGEQAMSVLELNVPKVYNGNVLLTRTPDGNLGLATVMESRLHLWAMEIDGRGAKSWMLCRTVRLDALLPKPLLLSTRSGELSSSLASVLVLDQCDQYDYGESEPCAQVVGADEDGNAVFLRRADGVYMVRLESTPQVKRIHRAVELDRKFKAVYPYANIFF